MPTWIFWMGRVGHKVKEKTEKARVVQSSINLQFSLSEAVCWRRFRKRRKLSRAQNRTCVDRMIIQFSLFSLKHSSAYNAICFVSFHLRLLLLRITFGLGGSDSVGWKRCAHRHSKPSRVTLLLHCCSSLRLNFFFFKLWASAIILEKVTILELDSCSKQTTQHVWFRDTGEQEAHGHAFRFASKSLSQRTVKVKKEKMKTLWWCSSITRPYATRYNVELTHLWWPYSRRNA